MFYALNLNVLNSSAIGKATPFSANNPLCEMDQPIGENYGSQTHYSQLTNEAYSWHYNSNGAHYIMRVNGNGVCEIIYANDDNQCLQVSADPKHSIEQWRSKLKLEKICANRDGKYLMWTNGLNDIGFIDVEASIATNFFTTDFFKQCESDPCDFIRLCVPQPCECLVAKYLPLPQSELSLTNHLIDNGFKFMFQWEYYDGRKSSLCGNGRYFCNQSIHKVGVRIIL